MIRLKSFVVLLLAVILSSCENDPYDSGDGELSHITTAFGEISFDSEGRAFKFVTDEDQLLNFSAPYGKADTKLAGKVMRALLYYYITDEVNTVTPYGIVNVLTTDVIDKDKIKQIDEDPADVESVWLSKNKKYLNLSLKIKTSDPKGSDVRHKLGMIYSGGTEGNVNLQLLHDNGNIPGNYTVNVYFSVRMDSVTGRNPFCKTITVSAMTPDGIKTFEVELR